MRGWGAGSGGGDGGLVKMIFRPRLVSFAPYSYYKIIRITKSNESQAHANISKRLQTRRLYVLHGNCDLMKLIGDKKLLMITEKCYYFMRVIHPASQKIIP